MPRLAREIFHRWSEHQKGRFERIGGEPAAMSPARATHMRLKIRVLATLDRAVRQSGVDCEALGDGITIEIGDTDYEPDAVINCGPPVHPDTTVVSSPVLVFDVISASAQSIDTGEKLADYFRIPSLRHYFVVQARKQETVHGRRRGEDIVSHPDNIGTIHLGPPGITLDIAKVYESVAAR